MEELTLLEVIDSHGGVSTWGSVISEFSKIHAGSEGGGPYILGMFVRACVRDGLLRADALQEPAPYSGAPDGGEWGVRGAVAVPGPPLRRATEKERRSYLAAGIDLYGFVPVQEQECPIEVCREDGDTEFVVRAPSGKVFMDDMSGFGCTSLDEVRIRARSALLFDPD